MSFPHVPEEIKARVNYRKNLPKGIENTIEEGSTERREGRKLTRPTVEFVTLFFSKWEKRIEIIIQMPKIIKAYTAKDKTL